MTNIQDILDKHTPWISQQERLYDEASVKSMLREYGEIIVNTCAEWADCRYTEDPVWEGKSSISGVDKQSILRVKDQIK